MLKIIKDYFIKTANVKEPDFNVKNKLRFESIHSDKRSDSLKDIYKRLIEQDQFLTNNEVLEHYFEFSKKIQTNTFAAAELELVSVSTLCYFRPELTDVLIRNGLLSIVYSLGDNINFEDVINFVQQRILAKNVEPYGGWPQEEGIKWLSGVLPQNKDLISKVLVDVITKNKEELDSIED
jgi:hypothetical protein